MGIASSTAFVVESSETRLWSGGPSCALFRWRNLLELSIDLQRVALQKSRVNAELIVVKSYLVKQPCSRWIPFPNIFTRHATLLVSWLPLSASVGRVLRDALHSETYQHSSMFFTRHVPEICWLHSNKELESVIWFCVKWVLRVSLFLLLNFMILHYGRKLSPLYSSDKTRSEGKQRFLLPLDIPIPLAVHTPNSLFPATSKPSDETP